MSLQRTPAGLGPSMQCYCCLSGCGWMPGSSGAGPGACLVDGKHWIGAVCPWERMNAVEVGIGFRGWADLIGGPLRYWHGIPRQPYFIMRACSSPAADPSYSLPSQMLGCQDRSKMNYSSFSFNTGGEHSAATSPPQPHSTSNSSQKGS